jgi:hypothetical protein
VIGRHLVAAPARRLLRDAGPPTSWVIASFVVAGLAGVLLYGPTGGGRVAAFVSGILILAIPSLLDRTGWQVRLGMAWLAAEQRRTMTRIPRTPAGAERWLAGSTSAESPFARASVLLMAGRADDARRAIEAAPTDDPEDRARAARILAAIDGIEGGVVDPQAANAAIEALPEDRRRYHRVGLAWSTAWVEAMHGRPWRPAFADASAGIAPTEVPARFLIWHVIQEFLAPIVAAVVIALLVLLRIW